MAAPQAYEHAAGLIHVFATFEMGVDTLLQLDRLVQLVEAPVFAHLRLQLLEPEKQPHLLNALYGLLMLLPQVRGARARGRGRGSGRTVSGLTRLTASADARALRSKRSSSG